MSDKIIPIRQERLDAYEATLKALRAWLDRDTLRRAGMCRLTAWRIAW